MSSLYTQPEKILTREQTVSFATGQQGSFKFYFPYKVRVLKIRAIVTAALAGTDAGTITGGTSAGPSTGGQISFPLSTVFGTVATPVRPTTNNIVQADDYYEVVTAKSTAGGTAHVQIEAIRL